MKNSNVKNSNEQIIIIMIIIKPKLIKRNRIPSGDKDETINHIKREYIKIPQK